MDIRSSTTSETVATTRRRRHTSDSTQPTMNFGGFNKPTPPVHPRHPPRPPDPPETPRRAGVDGFVLSPPPSYHVVQENKDNFADVSQPPPYPGPSNNPD